MKKYLLQGILLLPLTAFSQTVIWSENFNNNCSANCTAIGYNGGNGAWTQTVTGAEGTDPNMWYVSCAENGYTAGNCGSGCVPASATATLATLHVGSNPNSLGDLGAAYDAGGLCGILTCPQTDRRIESPTINCSGQSTITLSFNYIENGDPPNDDASVWYFDGTTWSLLSNTAQTLVNCAGGQGRWTAFSIALPASANNNPNVKIGFLWVNNDDGVGTDPSFAVDDVTLTVPSSTAPVASFTASATTVCAGIPVNFTDNSTGGPTSWSWTFPGATPASATTQNVTGVVWNTAGTYTVTLTATNGSGSNSTTQVITVVAAPTVTVSASNTSICSGTQVTLNALGATSYVWLPGNQTTPGITDTPTTTTTYTVTGVNAQNCPDTAQITITVTPAPVVSATTANTVICPGDPAILNASGAVSYVWQPGNLTGSSVTVNPSSTTTYTVTGTNAASCTGTSQVTVTVQNCIPPVAAATASGTSGCQGDCFSFTDNSTGGPTSWQWQFPGGTPATSTQQNPANVCYNSPGTYDVILIVTNAYGTDTITLTGQITISSPFTLNAGANQTVAIGNSTTLSATGAPAGSTYVWTPTNGLSCTTCASPTATPLQTTTYTVTATSPNGCTSTDTVRIEVLEAYGLFVPSAFSPNNDGANDVLFVRGAGVKELHFIVYSRIGEKVFESTSLQDGWDGTFRGMAMNTGIFAYYVTADFYDGTSKVLKGDVTLVR